MKLLGILLLLASVWILSVSKPLCPSVLTNDITNGTKLDQGYILHQGIMYSQNSYYFKGRTIKGCVCKARRCIRKCCAFGEVFVNGTCAQYETDLEFDVYYYDNYLNHTTIDHFTLIPNMEFGARGFFRLSPLYFEEDTFFVQGNGSLYMPYYDNDTKFLDPENFCMETFIDDDEVDIAALASFTELKAPHTVVSFGMITSMPFLLITFLVYAILPERNIHAKALMCYVMSLMWAYIFLSFIQMYPDDLDPVTCKTTALFCLYFFMASFLWINVMSFDLWWAFSGLRGFSGSKKQADRKRFLLYSAYAWGVALLHVLLVTFLILVGQLPESVWYNPGLGDNHCWFEPGLPTFIYFYGPMAILILANIVMFVITAIKIKQTQKDTAMLRKDDSNKHSYDNNKQRFNLFLKLMLAMGVNWSLEIVSWALNWQVGSIPTSVWYLTDFCNALYGVVIFFIFVFKKTILKSLRERYYMVRGKPQPARVVAESVPSSARTTRSSVRNTANSETHKPGNGASVKTTNAVV